MPAGRSVLVLFAASLFALVASSCSHPDVAPAARKEATRKQFEELKARVEQKLAERKGAKAPIPPRPATSEATPAASTADVPKAPASTLVGPSETMNAAWIVDRPVQIGPPSPATATELGVLMNTIEGDLALARLDAPSHSASPVTTKIEPLPSDAGPFALGRGPGLFGDFAYWISHGTLVRRHISARGKTGPLEFLAKDAFDGTRVGVPIPAPGKRLAKIPATVAYIVRPDKPDGPLVAKLWVEGQSPSLLTSEGNSTHSVSLVHTGDGVLVLSVQARMAITPVQARKVTFDGAGSPSLGDDVVVWVGGGIQPLTEMTVLAGDKDALFGFIPHERSIAEFGIARLDIGMNPSMDTKTTWTLYANGVDPAPVAAGRLCGESVLLYARPETAAPDSEQELVLQTLGSDGETRTARIETAKAFYFVSYAEVQGGALATWVKEDGTFATTIRCKAVR
jgi:hypothetical protein